MAASLAGSRIREARIRIGMTQVALAQAVGISPSYLNLIEHNRRGIGGATLNAIAETLGLRPADLSEGRAPGLVPDLKAAAAEHPEAGADPQTAEALAGRFEDWAQLLVTLKTRDRDQRGVIAALSDRLTHDPFLSDTVHAMLSNITAIRSAAGIMTQVANIDPAQGRRFLESMHAESERLSEAAQALADYLGAAAARTDLAATAEETRDQYLARNAYVFHWLDEAAEDAAARSDTDFTGTMESAIDAHLATDVPGGSGQHLIRAHLLAYAADARAMPLHRFAEAASAHRFDPTTLAQAFGVDIPAVFRRLSVLRRPKIDAPDFGLIVVSASGYPLLRRPLADFALPRHGNACPLWPLFQGFARPGQPILERIRHDNGATFVTCTHAAPRTPPRFGQSADIAASMLIAGERDLPDLPPMPLREVGTACRICTRQDCTARVERPLIG
ncbi:DUF2083 domain-containing protein [Halovulum dunhuangense]|uniref:DUF2083 domain-containing protein n=1 Tax=Halovulum dunhuangense TaxID=1505036 RepID=A0A849KQH4_9RHOB|nr:short-chain fatty acyl-CoA regulator family protein [Halovulum dunhuangense]NNU79323.1 DUF2083 domain-containing protein [Halovulum dunhuangense]